MKGEDLKRVRTLNGRSLEDVAGPMGVSRQRISSLEGQADVKPDTTARYLSALSGVKVTAHVDVTYQTEEGVTMGRDRYTVEGEIE